MQRTTEDEPDANKTTRCVQRNVVSRSSTSQMTQQQVEEYECNYVTCLILKNKKNIYISTIISRHPSCRLFNACSPVHLKTKKQMVRMTVRPLKRRNRRQIHCNQSLTMPHCEAAVAYDHYSPESPG